ILEKPPSAELRRNQRDEDELGPYEKIDDIIRLYVEEDASPDEIVERGLPRELVSKITELIDRSEYKRRQGPPGIRISPRAFGKDRRYPITNSFRRR
ncbi:MAG TPA: NAD+ synthase, partial [Euryarchaeota archaeon]|nr:NAD+ synthase [Euryarchaeota archaeon]